MPASSHCTRQVCQALSSAMLWLTCSPPLSFAWTAVAGGPLAVAVPLHDVDFAAVDRAVVGQVPGGPAAGGQAVQLDPGFPGVADAAVPFAEDLAAVVGVAVFGGVDDEVGVAVDGTRSAGRRGTARRSRAAPRTSGPPSFRGPARRPLGRDRGPSRPGRRTRRGRGRSAVGRGGGAGRDGAAAACGVRAAAASRPSPVVSSIWRRSMGLRYGAGCKPPRRAGYEAGCRGSSS